MDRNATAVWNGTIKEGTGHLSTTSKTLDHTPYSYKSRFEQGTGTNPEELIAAAHAGCFTMQLTANLSKEGFTATELHSVATVSLDDGAISQSHIKLTAKVPNISAEKFEELVRHAEKNCPVSKLLDTKIEVEFELETEEKL